MKGRACILASTLLLAAGCSGGSESGANEATTAASTAAVTEGTSTSETPVAAPPLRLFLSDQNTGPWNASVKLKLRDDLIPVTFFVCGIAAEGAPSATCDAPPGTRLPAGMLLRLEQRPKGSADGIPGSPGWGTVGSSDTASLSVPLSNFVSGNEASVISYRITLRPIAGGDPIAISNVARVIWQR